MPAVLIGVGGIGGEIVATVRRNIDQRVHRSHDIEAQQKRADQFRFLHIDTREMSSYAADFKSDEIFVIPGGLNSFGVNRRVSAWDVADPYFSSWWPRSHGEQPYLPDDFVSGAGQVRTKGKLAYRIELSTNGNRIVRAVQREIKEIENIRNVQLGENSERQMKVYIISSLAGGTGSGIVMALAQHLKMALDPHCALIGVFLMASVAEKAAGKGFAYNVWSNTDAALREIEFWQSASDKERNAVSPFLQWSEMNRIPGADRDGLFNLIYLYGANNAAGKALQSADQYKKVTADCLTTELFSDLDDQIHGVHVNWMHQIVDLADIHQRSIRYASAGKSDLRFPVDRITQHLARRFGEKVIREQLLLETDPDIRKTSEDAGRGEIAQFIASNNLEWVLANGLKTLLEKPVKKETALPAFSAFPNLAWTDAPAASVDAVVRQARDDFQKWIGDKYAPHLSKRADEVIQELTGPNGEISKELQGLLASSDSRGFVQALAASRELVVRLDAEIAKITELLNTKPGAGPTGYGLQNRVTQWQGRPVAGQYIDKWAGAIQQVQEGYGRIRDRKGEEAKNDFETNTWQPYIRDEKDLIAATQSLRVLHALVSDARRLDAMLNQVRDGFNNQAIILRADAEADLGEMMTDGTLDVGVMDEVQLVDVHFKGDLKDAFDSDAISIGKRMLEGDKGAGDTFRAIIQGQPWEDARVGFSGHIYELLTEYGRSRFEPIVKRISVWDALSLEASLREQLNIADTPLQDARAAAERHRDNMVANGLKPEGVDKVFLRHYISKKLQICKERSQPFWQLDELSVTSYGNPSLPFDFQVMGYDQTAFKSFATRTGLTELIDQLESDLGVQAGDTAGADAVHFYQREGGVPLHFLHGSDLKRLRDSFRIMRSNNKQAYTDRRYASYLPPLIAAGESPDQQLAYAIATLLLDGSLIVDYSKPDPVTFNLAGQTISLDSIQEASGNPHVAGSVVQAASGHWVAQEVLHPAGELDRLIAEVGEIVGTLQPGAERNWWNNVRKQLQRRKQYEWYVV